MQILFLEPLGAFLLDVIVWILLHLGIGFYSSKIPAERFNAERRFYRSFPWENGGRIYQKLFHIRTWKSLLPNGSKLRKGAFSIKNLPSLDLPYLERWLRESIRAEFCHWMMVIPSVFFFLWNSAPMGWAMVAYAALNNFFPIAAQRFNRPRVRRFLEQARQGPGRISVHPASAEIGYSLVSSSLR